MRLPLQPRHPERVCWGCDRYCPATDMACSKERTVHPLELLGEGWWTEEAGEADDDVGAASSLGRSAEPAALPGCTLPPREGVSEGDEARSRVRADAADEQNERCRSR